MNRHTISRRTLLQTIGVAFAGAPIAALAQGRCMLTFGTPACNTDRIAPVFAPTGWKTISLEHITFRVADYKKEAAFYIALMGWKLRSDDGKQAVLDIGEWGSVIFKAGACRRVVEAAPPQRRRAAARRRRCARSSSRSASASSRGTPRRSKRNCGSAGWRRSRRTTATGSRAST